MKTIIRLLFATALIMAVGLPLSAQTSDDFWATLGEVMGSPSSYDSEHPVILKKIAYDTHYKGKKEENIGDILINLNSVKISDTLNLKYKIDSKENFTVSGKFWINKKNWKGDEMLSDGKYYYIDGSQVDYWIKEDGLKKYNFKNAVALIGVSGLPATDPENSSIFNRIQIAIDPRLNPGLIENITQRREQKEKKAIDSWSNGFTNRDYLIDLLTEGLQPAKTDQLDNGMICLHYPDKKKRLYKKDNGDYAFFREIKDSRDEKTMDVIKGVDVKFDENTTESSLDYFRVTLPNGVVLCRFGDNIGYVFPNGDHLIVFGAESHPATCPTLKFKEFLDPNDRLGFYKLPEHRSDYKKSLGFFRKNGSDSWEYVKHFAYDFFFNEDTRQAYRVTKDGLTPYGYYPSTPIGSWGMGVLLNGLEVEEVEDNGNVTFTNKDFVRFTDGNGFKESEFHLTYPDGTVIEQFAGDDRNKLTFPDGSKYVGYVISIGSNGATMYDQYIDKLYGTSIVPPEELDADEWRRLYSTGTFFGTDGKELAYKNGVSEKERMEKEQLQKKQDEKVLKSLYAKYGENNVRNAMALDLKVGMDIHMLEDMKIKLYHISSSVYSDWYKVLTNLTTNYNPIWTYICVDKKTGKITYLGDSLI